MKLEQSALWAAIVAVPSLVPVTALAQLSASQPGTLLRWNTLPRAVTARPVYSSAIFIMEDQLGIAKSLGRVCVSSLLGAWDSTKPIFVFLEGL